MRGARLSTPTLCLLAILAAPGAARAGDGIFSDPFEPNPCNWSSISAPCESEAEFESRWTGAQLEVCVPESSGLITGGSYTICPGSTCPDGAAAGCTLIVHVDGANADFTLPAVDFALAAEDAHLPVSVVLFTIPSDCQLDITAGGGTVDVDLDAPACTAPYLFVQGTTGATAAADATFGVSGCAVAGALEKLIDLIKPTLIGNLESGLEGVAAAAVEADLAGTLLCAP